MAFKQPPSEETTAALVAETIEATGCNDLAEMPVALAEDPSVLAEWLRHAYRRGFAEWQAEHSRELVTVLDPHAKAELAALVAMLPRCAIEGCERSAEFQFGQMYEEGIHYRCLAHHDPDEGDGWGEVPWRSFLPEKGGG